MAWMWITQSDMIVRCKKRGNFEHWQSYSAETMTFAANSSVNVAAWRRYPAMACCSASEL